MKNYVRPFFALALAALSAVSATPALAQTCSAPVFRQTAIYPVGGETRAVAAADFDGDGRADLAVADISSNSVTVVTKIARDTPAELNTYPVGRFPVDVDAADFNADGKLDLVVANNSASSVTVLLNDGDGRFLSNGEFAVGGQVTSVAVGDFNSDGKADLAAACEFSFRATALFGDGEGGFGAPVNIASFQQPSQVLAADFNADGKLDLAVTASSAVHILLGTGAGTFAAQPSTCAQTFGIGLASGDLNGDGRADLVTSNILGNNVGVVLGNGAGCFGAATTLSGGSRYIQLADLNSDGKLDIIQGTARRLGDGAGGFGAPVAYGTGSVGAEPGANTAVADFDADGRADLATAGAGTAGILFGDGAGGFRFAVGPRGPGALGLERADFNGDGAADLVTLTNGNVTIMRGDGAGGFGPPANFPSGPSAFRGPVVADFNRDGKHDVAVLDGSSKYLVLPGDGAGALGAPISTTFADGEASGLAGGADFNNDGAPDLLTLQRTGGFNNGGSVLVLLGDGAGHFLAPKKVSVNTATNPQAVGVADFDADGKLDLAVPSGFGFSVLRGDGAGGFGQLVHFISANASSVAVSDFNGDGKHDLALVSEDQNGRLSVVLGDGQGGFGLATHYAVGFFPRDVAAADFNGDGKTDLAVASARQSATPFTGPSVVSVLLGDGAGGFSPATSLLVDRNPSRITAGDLNGDGRADIATANENVNNLSVLLNACGAASGSTPTFQFGASLYSVGEGAGGLTVTVTRTGSTAGAASVAYSTSDGTASSRSDYIAALGTLRFADGESAKTFRVHVIDDGRAGETGESLRLTLSDPVGAALGGPSSAVVSIADNDPTVTNVNPIDGAQFFVRQHYLDFLNREPDAEGLQFWTNEITSCGSNAACREVKRINVSAAFFLSIEFQETGFLVYRMYKAAYGDATSPNVEGTAPVIRLNEFLADTQEIGQGVVVNQGDWRTQLENNKQAFAREFVQRQRFTDAFPVSMTAAGFVDKLNANAGGVLSQAERDALVSQLSSAADQSAGRAAALRGVAETRALRDAEINRAFVLMQFYGYLRRNPDDPQDTDFRGWKFWLDKLNQFNGDAVAAEMVKAFLDSAEYRGRFNSPNGF